MANFFEGWGNHQDLTSSPTRRSSDLGPGGRRVGRRPRAQAGPPPPGLRVSTRRANGANPKDRKSTRLNSSHANISYAVFCLKKKNYPTLLMSHLVFHASPGSTSLFQP